MFSFWWSLHNMQASTKVTKYTGMDKTKLIERINLKNVK